MSIEILVLSIETCLIFENLAKGVPSVFWTF
jgi:hypothetical protein